MTDGEQTPERKDEPRRRRTFSFNINLGKGRPAADGPAVGELIEWARREAEASPDAAGTASREEEVFSLEYADGRVRVGGQDVMPAYERAPDEARPRLPGPTPGYHADGVPDTDAMRKNLGRIKIVVVIALPLIFLALGAAGGYSRETVIWMGVFGLVLSAMMAAMLPG